MILKAIVTNQMNIVTLEIAMIYIALKEVPCIMVDFVLWMQLIVQEI
jgi:hypothetical protein